MGGTRIHGHGECRGHVFSVDGSHQGKSQGIRPFPGKRSADQSSGMGHHEVDHVRSRPFRSANEVSLVFAAGVVGDNDHAAVADFFHNGFYRAENEAVVAHGVVIIYSFWPRNPSGRPFC